MPGGRETCRCVGGGPVFPRVQGCAWVGAGFTGAPESREAPKRAYEGAVAPPTPGHLNWALSRQSSTLGRWERWYRRVWATLRGASLSVMACFSAATLRSWSAISRSVCTQGGAWVPACAPPHPSVRGGPPPSPVPSLWGPWRQEEVQRHLGPHGAPGHLGGTRPPALPKDQSLGGSKGRPESPGSERCQARAAFLLAPGGASCQSVSGQGLWTPPRSPGFSPA